MPSSPGNGRRLLLLLALPWALGPLPLPEDLGWGVEGGVSLQILKGVALRESLGLGCTQLGRGALVVPQLSLALKGLRACPPSLTLRHQ